MFIAIPLSRHVKEQIDKTDAILNELKPFLVLFMISFGIYLEIGILMLKVKILISL